MQGPPAVTYPAGAPKGEYTALALLALAWAAGLMLWLALAPNHVAPASWWLSFVLGMGLLSWCLWRLRASTVGELVWEPLPAGARRRSAAASGEWRWFSPAWRRGLELTELRCVLDLQGLLLLRWRSASGLGGWIWLERAQRPEQWRALRAAVLAQPLQ
jgi:hypothetical protein